MKRLLSLVLVLVMVLSLAACGTKEEPVEKKEDPVTVVDEKETETEKEMVDEAPVPDEPIADLSDERVRKAIAYAIDMDTLVAGLFEGKASPTNSLTPPSDAFSADGLVTYTYNPEKAKELLEAANWDYDYELDVVFYYGDQQTVDLMTAIQAYLGEVGMKMSFRKVEGDVAAQLWSSPEDQVNGPAVIDWDLCYGAVAALSLHDYYNRFSSVSDNNSHTPTDTELDALIAITNSTADLGEQKDAFQKIQAQINSKALAIPLYHQQLFIFESDRLDRAGHGYGNEQYAYDWGISNWNLEGSKTLQALGAPVEIFASPFVNPGLDIYNKFVFDRLIQADAALTPSEGLLAESYEMSSDGMELTLKLREGVKWHDGQAFDTEDVAFTMELLALVPTLPGMAKDSIMSIEGAQAFVDGSADSISGIAIDGSTMTITYEKLNPNVLLVLSQWPMLPEHLLGNANMMEVDKDKFWQNPVGTGPFKVNEVKMNDYATFTRNADYFMPSTGNIENIQLTVGGDQEGNLVLSAEAGRIDYAFGKSVPDAKAIEILPNMVTSPVEIRYTRLIYVNKFPQE